MRVGCGQIELEMKPTKLAGKRVEGENVRREGERELMAKNCQEGKVSFR